MLDIFHAPYYLVEMNTKTDLLDSAERAVRERGYDGFSYADLAADVGIRKASIHHHFPTKADLGLALIQRYRETVFKALHTIEQKNNLAADRILAYLKIYRDALNGGSQLCLCVSLSIGRDKLNELILQELAKFHKDNIKWLESCFTLGKQDGSIKSVGKPGEEASACQALVEGGQSLARSAKKVAQFDRAVAQLKSRCSDHT